MAINARCRHYRLGSDHIAELLCLTMQITASWLHSVNDELQSHFTMTYARLQVTILNGISKIIFRIYF